MIATCNTYSVSALKTSLQAATSSSVYDHLARYRQQHIVVKVNASMPRQPETACCTHPAVVDVVLQWLSDMGARPVIVESSCLATSRGTSEALLQSGIAAVAHRHGTRIINLDDRFWPDFRRDISPLYSILHDLGAMIVSVAKAKTHSMLGFSGCVKNCYGLIPGKLKSYLHSLYPSPREFSRYLLQHVDRLAPTLGVVDAVVTMQGNGPTHGTPFMLGRVGVSEDMFLMDAIVADQMGLPIEDIPFFQLLIESRPSVLSVVAKHRQQMPATGEACMLPASFTAGLNMSTEILKKKYEISKPVFTWDVDLCNYCMRCVDHCPINALSLKAEGCIHDKAKCVRCMCCAEVCMTGAIVFVASKQERGAKEMAESLRLNKTQGGVYLASLPADSELRTVQTGITVADAKAHMRGAGVSEEDTTELLRYVLRMSAKITRIDETLSLNPRQAAALRSALTRWQRREPLHYITGEKVFYGRRFTVNPSVLIPRVLAHQLVDLVKKNVYKKDSFIVEVGTGSGCIGITLYLEGYRCIGMSDISELALSVAALNVSKYGCVCDLRRGDLLSPWLDASIDVIVANLPYVPDDRKATLPAETLQEPWSALFAGPDGSIFYRRLISGIREHPEIMWCFFEVEHTSSSALRDEYEVRLPHFEWQIVSNLMGKPGILTGRSRSLSPSRLCSDR